VPDADATPAIRVTTRLVLVDTIVTDKDGKPVTDLKPEDFTLEDSGKKQKLAFAKLEQAGGAATVAPQQLPPNVYTNRPEFNMPGANGIALTILMVDGLNTSFQDVNFGRAKLIEYVRTQLKPGQQIAVYALANNLYRLQDFTSDPKVLIDALENYKPQVTNMTKSTLAPLHGSAAVSSGGAINPNGQDGPGMAALTQSSALNRIAQFEAEAAAPALEVRIETTLLSLRTIARLTAGHAGRKNLIWVSSGFPFSLVPEVNQTTYLPVRPNNDPTAPPPLPQEQTLAAYSQQIRQESVEKIRRTAALLSEMQVAVYPVDARGLFGSSVADASNSGLNSQGLLRLGSDYGSEVSSANSQALSSQAAMHDIASQTGGRVFKNRNDIDNAVATAAADGAVYYNLGYYPDKKKFDGSFHNIKVQVSRPGLTVRTRKGYYAIDPARLSSKERDAEMAAAISNDSPATMVVFDARVVPPPPAESVTVPIQFLVRPETITAEDAGQGRHLSVDFYVAAFAGNGKIVANNGKTVDATITPEQFGQLQQQGLSQRLDVTLGPGEYSLRLGVRDNRTGYIGTINVPLTLRKPGS
jgi:VWFA-related protein